MKTKYVCHGLISLHASFCNYRTQRTDSLLVKFRRWVGGGKGPKSFNNKSIFEIQIASTCYIFSSKFESFNHFFVSFFCTFQPFVGCVFLSRLFHFFF